MNKKKKMVLIVTGSIAACKVPELLAKLKQDFILDVIFTRAPEQWQSKPRWISVEKISAATNGIVLTASDSLSYKNEVIRKADFLLVAPATADFISQLSYQSSELAHVLMETHLGGTPLFIAPAMNYKIWEHPSVQRNCANLVQQQVVIMGPVEGRMACNDFGFGRMISVDEIARRILDNDIEGAKASYLLAKKAAEKQRGGKEAPLSRLLIVIAGHKPEGEEVEGLIAEANEIGLQIQIVLDKQGQNHLSQLERLTRQDIITDHYQIDPEGLEHIKLPEQASRVIFPFVDEALAKQMVEGASRSLGMDIYLASKVPIAVILSRLSPPGNNTLSALRKDGVQIIKNLEDIRT